MEESFVTQMDDSYFIIPTSQTDSMWQKSYSQMSRFPSIRERTRQQEFVDDLIQGNRKEFDSLCDDCHETLVSSLQSHVEKLQSMLQAYQLASHNLASLSRQGVENSLPNTSDESDVNEKTLDVDIEELEAKIRLISIQENDQKAQLDHLKRASNATIFAIEDEIRKMNILEAQELSNQQHLVHLLELTCISQREIATLHRSTDRLSPLFYLSVTNDTFILNGFRVAYLPSPKQNLSWREIQFSWSILCQTMLCLRNLHGLSTTLAFRARDRPLTDEVLIGISKPDADMDHLNHCTYKFMNLEWEDGIPAQDELSKPEITAGSCVFRFIRLVPLRHRASISLKTQIISPHHASDSLSGYISAPSGPNKMISVTVPTLHPGIQDDLSKIQKAFATHTLHPSGASPDQDMKNPRNTKSTSEKPLMSVLQETNIMYPLHLASTGDNSALSYAQANYQISINLLALYVVCTALELNCADTVIDSQSALFPLLTALRFGSIVDDNQRAAMTPKLFRFIEESQAINIEDNSKTRVETGSASQTYGQDESAPDDFDSVFVHRGRSASDMGKLVRDIVLATQALNHVNVSKSR